MHSQELPVSQMARQIRVASNIGRIEIAVGGIQGGHQNFAPRLERRHIALRQSMVVEFKSGSGGQGQNGRFGRQIGNP